jgi:hypothetical protein
VPVERPQPPRAVIEAEKSSGLRVRTSELYKRAASIFWPQKRAKASSRGSQSLGAREATSFSKRGSPRSESQNGCSLRKP